MTADLRPPPPPPPPPAGSPPTPSSSSYHRTASGTSATSAGGAESKSGQQQQQAEDDKLSALLQSPSFTVASYLNLALDLDRYPPADDEAPTNADDDDDDDDDGERNDERLQSRTAELALLLQVSTQSCHDEIGRIGAELRAILPRCAGDVDRLGKGLEGMEEDVGGLLSGGSGSGSGGASHKSAASAGSTATVQRQSSKVGGGEGGGGGGGGGAQNQNQTTAAPGGAAQQQQPNPPAIETLSTLHHLRTSLAQTRSILSAASSWDATLSSVPSLLSTQSLTDAVSALSNLESGERALSGMPGREERTDAISRIRGQIEVLLKPQLLHALQRMDTRLGPLQSCVGMYGSLDKMDALMEEYVRQRPGEVLRGWFDYVPPLPPGGGGSSGGGAGAVGSSASSEEDEEREDGTGVVEAYDPDAAAAAAAEAFLGWLPGWYDAVLSLITEERRRATAVFGPRLAPEIIVRVLGECFRPILPSFKTRLASLCPPIIDGSGDAASGGVTPSSSSAGSLESICAAYESTLQFLSVAYDQMAASFDGASNAPPAPPAIAAPVPTTAAAAASTASAAAGPDGGGEAGQPQAASAASAAAAQAAAKSPLQVYDLLRSTYVTIASPFAPYQRNFAALELRHSGTTSRIVARDVQEAVGGRTASGGGVMAGTTLASLQDAVDKLGGLAPYLFPLVEGSVARYELLNCGYTPQEAMAAVDTLLANHAGELAIAIGTLTVNMTSDEDRLADSFDEEIVQCALEILKVAGTFKNDLKSFEDKTRDTLQNLLGRMGANVEHDLEIRAATMSSSVGSSSSSSSSVIPDSLTPVEVEAMLSKAVCGDDGEDDDENEENAEDEEEEDFEMPSLALLQRLSSGEKDGVARPVQLFPDTAEAVSRLASTCHVFVFDVCSAVPRRSLRTMSTLPVWRKESGVMDALSYGVLPQQYITQVGEHMLALVQALEPFASDRDALALANMVMDGAKNVALQPWKEFAAAIGGVDANRDNVIAALMSGKELASHVIRIADDNDGEEEDDMGEDDEEDEDEDAKAADAFCNQWLDVVGSAVTGRLLERMLRVHHLSEKGCEQLAVDLKYLINVFAALGVAGHPHPLIGHFAEVSEMNPEALREKILSRDTSNAVDSAVRGAEVRIALTRGIAIN